MKKSTFRKGMARYMNKYGKTKSQAYAIMKDKGRASNQRASSRRFNKRGPTSFVYGGARGTRSRSFRFKSYGRR